jgi:putative ABC transport system substrate-binding protein
MVTVRFLVLLALIAPLVAAAQPAGIPRLGVLAPTTCLHPNYQALREGLRALGYVEGQTIIIECREAAGRYERVVQHADELVRLKVDVLVTDGLRAARAAKEATKTIPIVMGAVGDPVRGGVVNSLARPGANITGLTLVTGRDEPQAARVPQGRRPREPESRHAHESGQSERRSRETRD